VEVRIKIGLKIKVLQTRINFEVDPKNAGLRVKQKRGGNWFFPLVVLWFSPNHHQHKDCADYDDDDDYRYDSVR